MPSEALARSASWKPARRQIVTSALPPFLPLTDSKLRLSAFTHKSYAMDHPVDGEGSLGADLRSFKRLEKLGDSLIGAQVSLAIMILWPDLSSSAMHVSRRCPTSKQTHTPTPD